MLIYCNSIFFQVTFILMRYTRCKITSAVTQTSLKGNSSSFFFKKNDVYKTLTKTPCAKTSWPFWPVTTSHTRGIGLLSKRIGISSFQGQIVIALILLYVFTSHLYKWHRPVKKIQSLKSLHFSKNRTIYKKVPDNSDWRDLDIIK